MSPDAQIPLDRAHYDMIVSTARDVKSLCKAVDTLATEVKELKGQLGKCPCPAVKEIQEDVEALQQSASFSAGKMAGLIAAITLAVNVLIAWMGGRA